MMIVALLGVTLATSGCKTTEDISDNPIVSTARDMITKGAETLKKGVDAISDEVKEMGEMYDRIANVKYQNEASRLMVEFNYMEKALDDLFRRNIIYAVETETENGTLIEGFSLVMEQADDPHFSVYTIPSHMQPESIGEVHMRPIQEQNTTHPLIDGEHAPFGRVFVPDTKSPPIRVPANRLVYPENDDVDVAVAPLAAGFNMKKPDRLPTYTGEIPTGTPLLVIQWQWGAPDSAGRPVRANMATALYSKKDGTVVTSATSTPGESGGIVLMINPEHMGNPTNPKTPKFLIAGFLTRGTGETTDYGDRSAARPGSIMVPGSLIHSELLEGNGLLLECLADGTNWREKKPCADLR